ncbi:MAG: M16 family metallopeptidase [Chitinophagaceae bacterium]
MLERKVAPYIKDAVEFDLKLKPYQKYTLDNGVDVYAIDAGAEEVVMVECVYRAGNWFENKNLIAATANYLLKNGTTTKNAFAINEHFEYYGSYLNRACHNEFATLTLHSLTKHLKELLPVIKELLTDSIFPEPELKIYKQNMKQRLNVNLKKSDFVAGRLIDAYVFGENHPYGRFTRFEDFDGLNREQVIDFYKQFYLNGNLIIFVAGKLPGNLFEILNKSLGNLNNNAVEIAKIDIDSVAEKKHRITNDPSSVQGAIRLASRFPNRHHPDFIKVQLLNNLFGGFFGSRLMSNIREDKGYTYGIHSYLQSHRQQSSWMVSTEAGRDVCEATIEEVYKEMERLRNEPVGREELLLVQNYMMGSILGDLDGPFHIINRWKTIILNDLPEDYFYQQINTIKNIKPNELHALANKYLVPENFYELVVL